VFGERRVLRARRKAERRAFARACQGFIVS
jgi:hypothetical protein